MPRRLALLASLLLLPSAAAAQQSQDAVHQYAVRSGDKVTITMYTGAGVEYLPVRGERIVDRLGEVFLPLLGAVRVAGLDQRQIRDLLHERYDDFYDDHVVQVVVELNVTVSGAVGDPGQYFVPPTTTLVGAINLAGGMQPELTSPGLTNLPSDPTRVRLVRDGETTIINLRPDEVTVEIQALPVQSGDWIHVPNQARSRVRDELQFWGGILSFVGNLVAIIVLISR